MTNQSATLVCGKKVLSALNGQGPEPELILGHHRVGLFDPGVLPAGQPMDLAALLQNVEALSGEIKAQLVEMDEITDLMLLGLLSGVNILLVSKPGTAKSTIAGMLAQGLSGGLFQRLMNNEISSNDIFGMINPLLLQEGKWERMPGGVLSDDCNIIFVDEYYKAPGGVRYKLLEVFEERQYSEGMKIHRLKVLLAIAASNELVDPTINNPDYDRFGIRYEIKYLTRAKDFKRLLAANSGRVPIKTRLDPEEILLTQALVEMMAMNPPAKVASVAAKILEELGKKDLIVSPRRMKVWLRVAAAKALLDGCTTLEPQHLAVGEHILWVAPDTRQVVAGVVAGISDPARIEMMKARADYEELRNKSKTIKLYQEQALVLAGITRTLRSMESTQSPEAEALKTELMALKEEVLSKDLTAEPA